MHWHNFSWKKAIFVLLLLIPAMVLWAQQTGTIRGVVQDEQGNPLISANLYLEGTTMGASTDRDGTYIIEDVPAGTYTLVASYLGYKTVKHTVTVKAGETVTQNFELGSDALLMDAVVVTGTPGEQGITKRDASFAITTIPDVQIRQFTPQSTANLLELVPGVWSESSGGVAGANIFVRGMPSSGDAPFVTMAINGGPIFGTETLSFFEQSSIFRIDETVESSEAQRGGPSSVFSNAEPGMTVNFNLRKGGEVTRGRIKYETSDYNLQRFDGFVSGKVTKGLYYMAGGYIRTSPGIRNTQFNSENGKQFTIQLTRVFDRGVINAFTRITDDHGQWVLPMALRTGNDLGTFSPLGNATRFRELQINARGDTRMFDFANGRGWKGSVSGVNTNLDLGNGWTVRDNLTYTKGNANTFGFVPNGNPVRVSTLKSTLGLSEVRTESGTVLSDNDWVQNYGYWVVLKDIESVNNDLSFNKKFQPLDLTLGLYQARWSSNDFWTLGNHVPVHNVSNGDIIANLTAADVAAAGGGGPWNYGLQSAGDARTFAIYGAGSYKLTDALRLDGGARYEWFGIEYTLDSGPGYPDGTRDLAKSYTGKDLAYTGALNFDINEDLGLFGRYSHSFQFPHFDMIREGTYSLDKNGHIEANTFQQLEGGIKYSSSNLSLFATGFLNTVDVFDGDVGATRASALLTTRTYGVELDGALSYGDLVIRAIGTLQKGKIIESKRVPEVKGNSIWRQPSWRFLISPTYQLDLGSFKASLYGALQAVGKRWDSRENNFQLDGYTKIDAGVMLHAPGGLTFKLHGDNLTNSHGLTEGDPRDPTAANGRPIFGRSIRLSVSYDF